MRLEPIANPSAARRLGFPALALGATLAVAMGLALMAGANPLAVLGQIATGALGSKLAILETLNRATPLIFTGLAVAVAFRAKLWNIGAEAQLYIGAVMTVVLGTGLLPLPWPVLIPVLMFSAALGGALVLAVPTFLKTRFGVSGSMAIATSGWIVPPKTRSRRNPSVIFRGTGSARLAVTKNAR